VRQAPQRRGRERTALRSVHVGPEFGNPLSRNPIGGGSVPSRNRFQPQTQLPRMQAAVNGTGCWASIRKLQQRFHRQVELKWWYIRLGSTFIDTSDKHAEQAWLPRSSETGHSRRRSSSPRHQSASLAVPGGSPWCPVRITSERTGRRGPEQPARTMPHGACTRKRGFRRAKHLTLLIPARPASSQRVTAAHSNHQLVGSKLTMRCAGAYRATCPVAGPPRKAFAVGALNGQRVLLPRASSTAAANCMF